MLKLTAVLSALLFTFAGHAQTVAPTPQAIHSTPFYVGGVAVPKIEDSTTGVSLAANVTEVIRHRYLHVHFFAQNTGKTNFDLDPYTSVVFTLNGDTTIQPMNPKEVAGLAKSILRRKGFEGGMVAMAGSLSADSYSQYSNTNTYEHERSDNMTDAMAAKNNDNYKQMKATILERNTVAPGGQVVGEMYFEIPKQSKEKYNADKAHLTVTLDGTTYTLQF